MEFREKALKELQKHRSTASEKTALVGLDGFVDVIVHPVAQRRGQGDDFTAMKAIEEFGNRILGAAGKSTNIELAPKLEKLGGNGPIMANALHGAGIKTRYIGALGQPEIHPLFKDFAKKTDAISICDAAHTTAVEFEDGKIMLGTMASLDNVTFDQVIKTMGEGAFFDLFSRMDLISMINWTMVPNMTSVFTSLLDKVLPVIPPHEHRIYFFDLCDPEKRSKGDLITALETMSRFQPHGTVTLGLNLKEAQQVGAALGIPDQAVDEDGLKALASLIRQKLSIGTVIVHPKESAACATRDDSWWIPGPYVEKPLITTGAGDHFNAGFSTGQLLGLSPMSCLVLGVSFSGFYVRTAKSPSLSDIEEFIRGWN
jgi:sugar/nucleoside kinase (ribokinase family)